MNKTAVRKNGYASACGKQRQKKRKYRRHQLRRWMLMTAAGVSMFAAAYAFAESTLGQRLLTAIGSMVFEGRHLTDERTQSEAKALLADADVVGTLKEMALVDARYEILAKNFSEYPSDLLELAVKNSEALDFVLGYPENKDNPPAVSADNAGSAINEAGMQYAAAAVPFLQWDERWGYAWYGDSFLAVSGCGPTVLAMTAAGLTKDPSITPYTVACYAQAHGYYVDGAGSSWSLISEGSRHFGVAASELSLSEGSVIGALSKGQPIICSMLPGDFTTTGHFIVICGIKNGQLKIYDPNSRERSEKLWDYERIAGQVANMWAMSLA